MSSDSHESIPSVTGSELREESTSSNPRLKEEVFSESFPGADEIPDPGKGSSTSIVGDQKKLPRRLVTRSAKKSKLPTIAADSSGTAVSGADIFLFECESLLSLLDLDLYRDPPKGKVAVSFWSLEFGLRLLIQPFYCRLLTDLRMASIQLSPNFWRYVSSCYVLWHEQGLGDPSIDELKFLFNMNTNSEKEGLYISVPEIRP
ncbi:hypothetical protein ACOSQ2_003099 [Xanthoceras sorbifolium]